MDPEPVLQIGELDGEEPYLFRSVTGATRFGDGTIALVESGTREIRLFAENGTHLRSLGGQGEGPGEFGGTPVIAAVAGDTILAWDPRLSRLTWFDRGGDGYRERPVSLGDHADAPGFRTPGAWSINADGALLRAPSGLMPGLDADAEAVRARSLTLLPTIGAAPVTLAVLPGPSMVEACEGMCAILNPFGPRAGFRLGEGEDLVLVTAPFLAQISSFDGDGRLRRILRSASQRLEVSEGLEADIAALVAESYREREDALPKSEEERPARILDAAQHLSAINALPKPDSTAAFVGLLRGTDGALFAERWRYPPSAGAEHEVFDPDGRWLGTMWLPPELGEIHEIGPDYLLATWTGEYGVPYLRMYRILK